MRVNPLEIYFAKKGMLQQLNISGEPLRTVLVPQRKAESVPISNTWDNEKKKSFSVDLTCGAHRGALFPHHALARHCMAQ